MYGLCIEADTGDQELYTLHEAGHGKDGLPGEKQARGRGRISRRRLFKYSTPIVTEVRPGHMPEFVCSFTAGDFLHLAGSSQPRVKRFDGRIALRRARRDSRLLHYTSTISYKRQIYLTNLPALQNIKNTSAPPTICCNAEPNLQDCVKPFWSTKNSMLCQVKPFTIQDACMRKSHPAASSQRC
jgi:hypothetical protein